MPEHNESTSGSTTSAGVPSQELAGCVIGGRYRLMGQLGKGSMGVVYKAWHLHLDRPVAIKLLHTSLSQDSDSLERFFREGRILSSFNHPSLVAVHSLAVSECGQPFLVMEFLEGKSLATMLAEDGALGLPVAIDLCLEICSGLDYAHRHGVIHRDLKPRNILVTVKEDGSRQAKILDFGVARLLSGASENVALTGERDLIGTPQYMSPEQCLGKPADERSDIYSLGCLIYEMVIGTPLFSGETAFEVFSKHLQQEVTAGLARLPRELAEIVKKCLEQDPDRRYQSAGELHAALTSLALPAQWHARPGKEQTTLKPRKSWLVVQLAVVVLSVVAIATAPFLYGRWQMHIWQSCPKEAEELSQRADFSSALMKIDEALRAGKFLQKEDSSEFREAQFSRAAYLAANGDLEEADRLSAELLQQARAKGDINFQLRCTLLCARVAERQSQPTTSFGYLTDALNLLFRGGGGIPDSLVIETLLTGMQLLDVKGHPSQSLKWILRVELYAFAINRPEKYGAWLTQALARYESQSGHSPLMAAMVHTAKAHHFVMLRMFSEGREELKKALESKENLYKMPLVRAYLWLVAGKCCEDKSDYRGAYDNYSRAAASFNNASMEMRHALFNRARMAEKLGNFKAAEADLLQVEELAPESDPVRAQCAANLLFVYRRSGEREKAAARLKQLLALTANHFTSETAQVLYDISDALIAMHFYKEAESCLNRAISIYRRQQPSVPLAIASCLLRLAGCLEREGKFVPARQALEGAAKEFSLGGNELGVAQAYLNIAELLRRHGKDGEANWRRVLAVRRTTQTLATHAHASFNLGIWQWQRRHLYEAEASFAQAIKLYEQAFGKDSAQAVSSLNALGMTYQSQGRYREAKRLHERAYAIAKRAGMKKDIVYSLHGLASCHGALGMRKQAENYRQGAREAERATH